jgi:hypothetical protein
MKHPTFHVFKLKLFIEDKKKKKIIVGDLISLTISDMLPSSLIDSNVSFKWKQWKNKELGHILWLVALWG